MRHDPPNRVRNEHNIGAVLHGLRSWCANYWVPRDVAKAASGHTVASTEGAYRRSDLLEPCREAPARWADYVTT